MPDIVEAAPAKINLTLQVLGRRSDGYHELSSLVAFASVADRLTLDTDAPRSLAVTGPFAGAIAGKNLLATALALLSSTQPKLTLGAVTLEKLLPVAAGIGGGSADAAALLRAVRRANPERAAQVEWHGIATALGADVAVCLVGRAAWMGGKGETIYPLGRSLPPLDVVLVNPQTAVPLDKTAAVFRQLGAPPLDASGQSQPIREFADRNALLAFVREVGNDLAEAASAVMPEVVEVMRALSALPAVEAVALSGAGPTCFAVFPGPNEAAEAAQAIKGAHPRWWIQAAVVG